MLLFTFVRHVIDKGTIVSVDTGDSSSEIIIHDGTESYSFPTRIYDIRYGARRFLRMCNRKGVPCEYYSAYVTDRSRIDKYTGTYTLSGTLLEKYFITGREEEDLNLMISHFDPVLIKVLQPNYVNNIATEDIGNVFIEEAEIAAPAVSMFKRWDILRVQDKNWVVWAEPKLIYDHRGMLEGFKLVCRSLRTGIIDY